MESQIDVLDMYAQYVQAWNGDDAMPNSGLMSMKSRSAQEFFVLLETLDVLLGNHFVTDDHLLLNGDEKLWNALGRASNWYELGERLLYDDRRTYP